MTRPKNLGGLGFRNLEVFNLALLCRHVWRVLLEPSSLSARILKAKYFPTSQFLDAELGSQPSQISRAILDGREILKQGIVRRIGDGTTTDIWALNWIPRAGLMHPITSRVVNPPQFVSQLIDAMSATWKHDLVKEVFVPFDADAILKIPLCTRQLDDF